jgi:WD40 repeat protein
MSYGGEAGNELIMFDFDSGVIKWRTAAEPGSVVTALAFSHDGWFVASGCKDGKLSTHARGTGVRVFDSEGQADEIRTVRFLPDRLRVVSGGVDRMEKPDPETGKKRPQPLKVWDMRTNI